MREEGRPILELGGITKQFGQFRAVDDVSLSLRRGEIFSLLGPSGCGKSTTLRLVAGLEQPDAGEIRLSGAVLASAATRRFVPAQKRNMGMVFQSYAIWPHLSVFDTVAYPLVVRKASRAHIAGRVTEMLRLVGLTGYEHHLAPMLSGGQQQRAALARALIYEPDILLLDEPFSNLDVKLREQMRVELKLLQRRVGVTVILVTHDQLEALSLSDRIAVMNRGKVEQTGSPLELYERPRTPFVRDFIGRSLQLPGRLVSDDAAGAVAELPGGTRIKGRVQEGAVVVEGAEIVLTVRPENVSATPVSDGAGDNMVTATITALLFIGDRYECVLDVGGIEIRSFLPRVMGEAGFHEGQRIALALPAECVTIWPR